MGLVSSAGSGAGQAREALSSMLRDRSVDRQTIGSLVKNLKQGFSITVTLMRGQFSDKKIVRLLKEFAAAAIENDQGRYWSGRTFDIADIGQLSDAVVYFKYELAKVVDDLGILLDFSANYHFSAQLRFGGRLIAPVFDSPEHVVEDTVENLVALYRARFMPKDVVDAYQLVRMRQLERLHLRDYHDLTTWMNAYERHILGSTESIG